MFKFKYDSSNIELLDYLSNSLYLLYAGQAREINLYLYSNISQKSDSEIGRNTFYIKKSNRRHTREALVYLDKYVMCKDPGILAEITALIFKMEQDSIDKIPKYVNNNWGSK